MASSKHECNQGINDALLGDIISFLRKKYFSGKRDKIRYACKTYGDWLIYDDARGVLIQTCSDSNNLLKKINEGKVVNFRGVKILCLKGKEKVLKSEGLFSAVRTLFTQSSFCIKGILSAVKGEPKTLGWLINILTILIDLRDPCSYSISRMMTILLRMLGVVMQLIGSYDEAKRVSVHARAVQNVLQGPWSMVSESLSMVDAIMMLAIAGFPAKIISKLEIFSKLTGKRFSDSSFLMSIINEFLDIVISIVEYTSEKDPTGYLKILAVKMRECLGFVTTYKLIKEMTELVSTYHKNQQIVLDVQYRIKCEEVHKKITAHEATLMFCRDAQNKVTYLTWIDFSSIMVLVKNYSVSSRAEPVCVVFEGAAGVGKSTFMNKVVAAMKHANFSVYCHTVPDVNSGKDFYDDYMNQDVFVMDDVGQQGKSQWRSIINFVAPVKYPLECATAEKKNTKFFSSKLILCTTNSFMNLHGFTAKDCIAEPEALFRRCHVLRFKKPEAGKANDIEYNKYDYTNTHQWTRSKIDVWKNCAFPLTFNKKEEKDNLRDVYSMIIELLRLQSKLATDNAMSEDDLSYITENDANDFQDARSEGLGDFLGRFSEMASEWFSCIKAKAQSYTKSDLSDFGTIAGITSLMSIMGAMSMYFISFSGNVEANSQDSDISEIIDSWKKFSGDRHPLFSESGVLSTEDENNDVRKYFRFLEIFYYHEGVLKTEYCQASVSGRFILVPLHCVGENMNINIFRSWDRFQAKHYEFNMLPVKIEKSYPHLDIAILKIEKTPTVPFKNANMLFKRKGVSAFSSDLYFCNSYHKIRNIFGVNIKMVQESFKVVNYRKELSFGPDSGLTYGISALGLCGSMIVDKMNGFVGVHVAGNGTDGFAVVPNKDIREEISEIMLSSMDPNFEHRETDKYENFSGSRLTYDKAQLSYAMDKSNYRPTPLNRQFDENVERLCKEQDVKLKAPADVKKYGNGKNTLKVCSGKSFKPIGVVPLDEIEFAKECLRTMMTEFGDLTDAETAFGKGELIPPLNKDSVNGYGYTKEKSDYINFSDKTINVEFLEKLRQFEERVEKDQTTWEDFVAKEALKDEVRPVGKDPRTFRIMPLHHIFLNKKYLGELFAHLRKNMWSNGIAIGMNPYRDWAKLYSLLRTVEGHFALDFGKWDGSCHALIHDLVIDVVMEYYKGNKRKVLEAILRSTVRGFTLVGDELLMTTHSIPSGAWITALFNSLINRCLTAMCLYREMKKAGKRATVQDFLKIVDFVLGDDKITGSPKELNQYFNAITMARFAESLGMEVTDCYKKPVTEPFMPLEHCTFLKRSFAVHEKLGLVGPLAMDTVCSTLQWYDATKSFEDAMNGKSIVVQIESYLHSPKMKAMMQDIMREHAWYREMSDAQVYEILTRDPDSAFGMMKSLLDKNYV